MKRKLIRCEIRWSQAGADWEYFEMRGKYMVPLYRSTSGETKTVFLRRVADELKQRVVDDAPGFTLRIYKKNGQIQSERTYGPDPRKSKG